SSVRRGTEYEQESMRILQNGLSMSLRRVGGKADGGIDLQGWWWLPAENSSLYDHPNGYRRLRVLVQCKRESKKLGPKYIRELEGVLHRYGATQSSNEDVTSPPVVGMLISASPFSKMAITHAHSSPIPLVLLHLAVPEGTAPVTSEDPADRDSTSSEGTFASIVFNPTLGSKTGLLRGHCEARWEHAADPTSEGRLRLWWKGQTMKSWTP
ncbi:hypothetical protein PHLGIDRAFT_59943, partial [Phlebiopsis gigantea 11061_1 CR5-6]